MFRGLSRHLAVVLVSAALAAPASADDAGASPQGAPPMTPEQMAEMEAYQKAGTPGPQHAALAATAGTYDVKARSWHDPSGPPMEETGSVTRTMTLEGRVLVEEFKGSMMGMPFVGHGMMGYDNVSAKYWSTWTDSMSTGIMVSTGDCDAQQACTFTGTWNDPIKNGPITAHMSSRWTSPTTQVFEMRAPGKDGTEMKMMELTYTRR